MTDASHPDTGRGTTRRRFMGQAAALLSGCALAATSALAGCSSPPEGVGAAVDDLLADAVPEGAGLTVLAAYRGEIVYCAGRGVADRGSGVGAGCGTVYDIGSVTKQFTAAAVLGLETDAAGDPAGRPHERRWDEDGPYWNLRGNGGLLSTAPDMFRWHRALEGDRVLPEAAKEKLFTSHVREGDGASYYGYGWVVEPGDGGTTVWHNGGNGRSYTEFTRFLDEELMVFWATGGVRRDGAWNLEELDLTRGTAECVREHG